MLKIADNKIADWRAQNTCYPRMSAVQFDQLIVNAATSRDVMSTQWLRHSGHKFW